MDTAKFEQIAGRLVEMEKRVSALEPPTATAVPAPTAAEIAAKIEEFAEEDVDDLTETLFREFRLFCIRCGAIRKDEMRAIARIVMRREKHLLDAIRFHVRRANMAEVERKEMLPVVSAAIERDSVARDLADASPAESEAERNLTVEVARYIALKGE